MRRQFAEAVQDASQALVLEPDNAATTALLERAMRHRDMATEIQQIPSTTTPTQAGDAWDRGHAAWREEMRQMLSSLVPSPDPNDSSESSTQIVLLEPTGAALAAAATSTATERKRAEQGNDEAGVLAHRCSRAAASQIELQARLDEVERAQLEQLDEMGLDLRTNGRKVALVSVPQFSSLEDDIALGAPRAGAMDGEDPGGGAPLSSLGPGAGPDTGLGLHSAPDALLAVEQNATAATATMLVGPYGVVNGQWDQNFRAQEWRENQELAAEVSALEATHSRLAMEVAAEADQLGVEPPITPWRRRFDTHWKRIYLLCTNPVLTRNIIDKLDTVAHSL
jgi:hypothetical protein